MTLLLRDLAKDPLVKPATLDTLFSEVTPSQTETGPFQRQLARTAVPDALPLQANDYTTPLRALTRIRSMVGLKDPSIAIGNHSLLLALSTANTRSQALAHLRTITANLDALTSGITTTAKTLTLTARRASLPLSFQNNTKRAGILVRVHLDSPKLIFPDGPGHRVCATIGHYTGSSCGRGPRVGNVRDDHHPRVAQRRNPTRITDARHDPLGGVQRHRHRAHTRRVVVPRGLVGQSLLAHAPPPRLARAS